MSGLLDFDDDDLLDDLLDDTPDLKEDLEDDLLGFDEEDDLLDFGDESVVCPYKLVNPVSGFRFAEGYNQDPNTFKQEVMTLSKKSDPERPNNVSPPWKASRIYAYWLKNFQRIKIGNLHKNECAIALAAMRAGSYTLNVEHISKRGNTELQASVEGATKDRKYAYVLIKLPEKLEGLDNLGLLCKYYGAWLPLDGSVSYCGNWRVKN